MPKLVTDATGVRLTVALLVAAVGFVIAALSADHVVLAWGSVALSAVAAAMIMRRWRRAWLRRRDEPEDEPALLPEEPITGNAEGDVPFSPVPMTAEKETGAVQLGEIQDATTDNAEGPPGEEDTDAADLLVVYELTDEVIVVDEQPRYHLARCRWPDHEHVVRLPVREARDLGFTPCDRCRPDKALARQHRAAGATTAGS